MQTNIDPTSMVSFPPLPSSVIHLANLINYGNQNFEEITHVIELDPILTASVMRWANSSWSSAQSEIRTIWDAVVRLGTENVLKLAVGHHMMANMRKLCGKNDLSEDRLWRHSVSTALAVDCIRGVSTVSIPLVAFTSAIMHDMGKIVISRQLGYQETNEAVSLYLQEHGGDELTAEKNIAGVDHVTVGATLAEQWNLPKPIRLVIGGHHHPDELGDPLVDAVALADHISRRIGFGSYAVDEHDLYPALLLDRLAMDQADYETTCDRTLKEYDATAERWGCR